VEPSLLTRIRWRVEDSLYSMERFVRNQQDGRVLVGLLLVAALCVGGFLAARKVARASSASTSQAALRVVTVRRKVPVMLHGKLVTRLRKVPAQAQTVLQTKTLHTATGVRVVRQRVTRYRVAYRKRLVRVHGKTRTVLQPLTRTQVLTKTRTSVLTDKQVVTNKQLVTVTKPVTVPVTNTKTLPVTTTVTVTVTVRGNTNHKTTTDSTTDSGG